jgi:hypothetical protein
MAYSHGPERVRHKKAGIRETVKVDGHKKVVDYEAIKQFILMIKDAK